MPKIVVGLDIGSKSICTTMSIENEDNEFEILNYICKESNGVEKGRITNIEEVTSTIKECLKELEASTGYSINSIYVGIISEDIRIVSTRGYTYIGNGKAINEKDILAAYRDGKNISINEDEYIVDGIINCFYTEEQGFVKNPISLMATKLEVDLDIIIAKKERISELKSVVLNAGYEVDGIILSIDSLKNIFLSERTTLDNVAVINVGSEKTELALYKNNQLKAIGFVPLGGRNITKDLSICLEIDEYVAEQLKQEYANEYISMAENAIIDIEGKEIDCNLIYEIIDARIDEIINYINKEILSSDLYEEIDYFIVTGDGISYFEDIKVKFEEKFGKKLKLFTKNHFYFNNSSIIDSIGIVKEAYDRLKLICDDKLFYDTEVNSEGSVEVFDNKNNKKSGFSRVRAFFNEIF